MVAVEMVAVVQERRQEKSLGLHKPNWRGWICTPRATPLLPGLYHGLSSPCLHSQNLRPLWKGLASLMLTLMQFTRSMSYRDIRGSSADQTASA